MSTDAHAAPQKIEADTSTKLFYGAGAIANGVKNNGFSYFLILFYSQVLGVPHTQAGLAIFIALLVDAVTDPLVGFFSDNLHSRWGRRHPLMYLSALPLAITYYFIWNPPENLGPDGLFYYLVAMAISVRIFMTLFEIPSTSLAPELTDDYDERTVLMGYRFFFGWEGGLTIAILGSLVFLVPTETISNGFLNEEGYGAYGALAALVILGSVIISSLGTHRHIPNLRKPPARKKFSFSIAARELMETLTNRSLAALFAAGIFGATAAGVHTTLYNYFNLYYWEFQPQQVAAFQFAYMFSAAGALVLAPMVSKAIGKKLGLITIGSVAIFALPLPVILRAFDLFPANHTDALFYTMLAFSFVDVTLIIVASILTGSMVADIVEESEVKTGRRSEGVFFAANSFITKAVSGLGALIATAILTAIAFPTQADPGTVDANILLRLAMTYAPTILVLYAINIFFVSLYKIDRAQHTENLQNLRAAAMLAREDHPEPPESHPG